MAVNKNFVVKNGLEVNTSLIVADTTLNTVGIATTIPRYTLHVFEGSGIGATDVYVTGFSTVATEFNVGSSGTVFTALGVGGSVGVGTALPAYLLDIRSPVSSGQTALYVQGDMHVTGDINLDDISLDQLYVTGLSTFVGFSTFQDSVGINSHLTVLGISTFNGYVIGTSGLSMTGAGITASSLNVTGVTTLGSNLDVNSFADISGNTNIGGITTIGGALDVNSFTDISGNINVGGIATVAGAIDANSFVDVSGNLNVGGISTFTGIGTFVSDLYVGGDLYISEDVILDTNLSILGIATIGTLDVTNNSTFGGDIDVDGHTELDNLNVAGFSTFGGNVDINSFVDISGNVNVGGLSTFVGFATFQDYVFIQDGLNVGGVTTSTAYTVNGTQVISSGRQLQNIASLDATTTATIEAAIANGPNTFTDISVSGLSTFVGFATFQDYVFIQDGLNVTGIGTFDTLHVGFGGTVLSVSENGTFAIGSATTAVTATLNGGAIPSIGLVIALGG